MSKVFTVDISKCSGCYNCQLACKDEFAGNDWPPYSLAQPATGHFWMKVDEHVEGTIPKVRIHYIPRLCNHCGKAACIPACPAGCIKKDEDTGFTVYDNTNCIGCRSCAMACPFGAPTFNSTGKMEKCDGCYVRVALGMEPACVKICPTKALRLLTEEEYQKEKSPASLAGRCEEITVPAVKI